MIALLAGLLLAIAPASATSFVGLRLELSVIAPGPNPFGLGIGVDVSSLPAGVSPGSAFGLLPDFGGYAVLRWERARDWSFAFGPRVGAMALAFERGIAYQPAVGVSVEGGPVFFKGGGAYSAGFGVQGWYVRGGYHAVFRPRRPVPLSPDELPRLVPLPGREHIVYAAFDVPIVASAGLIR